LTGHKQKAAAMEAQHIPDLSVGRTKQEASVHSSLIPVRKKNLTQKRGVDKRYPFKVYYEVACSPCRRRQTHAHRREIIFRPGTEELQNLSPSAMVVL
jgi:hypothetical protein